MSTEPQKSTILSFKKDMHENPLLVRILAQNLASAKTRAANKMLSLDYEETQSLLLKLTNLELQPTGNEDMDSMANACFLFGLGALLEEMDHLCKEH